MTQELEKVFIVGKAMQNAMRIDPEYADIQKKFEKEDFKVICLDDTQNKELFSGDKSKPIGDYQGLAIRSDLYVGDKSFYPLRDYCKNYFVQLEILMREIAGYMGACKWEYSFIEEAFESQKQNKGFDINGSAKSSSWSEGTGANKITHGADFGIDGGYGKTNDSQHSDDNKFDYGHSENLKGRKKTPQELAEFIKEQEINLDAFDPSFKKQIQDYISGEKIGTTNHKVDKSGYITEYNKTIRKISANVDIGKFFEAKFNLNLQDELKQNISKECALLIK